MKAADVMTRDVVTVAPDTPAREVAHLLIAHGISGVPVVEAGKLVGIVTEGDLIRRAELGTERRRGAWMAFLTGTATLAQEYVRSHGTCARDMMQDTLIVVRPDTPVAEIADLMETNHIRRVPVVEDGRVIGIVSRRNLLRAWALLPARTGAEFPTNLTAENDAAIRERLIADLSRRSWSRRPENSVVVTEGVAHLWGLARTEDEKRALELVAEQTRGVVAVRNHVVVLEAEPYPLLMGA